MMSFQEVAKKANSIAWIIQNFEKVELSPDQCDMNYSIRGFDVRICFRNLLHFTSEVVYLLILLVILPKPFISITLIEER